MKVDFKNLQEALSHFGQEFELSEPRLPKSTPIFCKGYWFTPNGDGSYRIVQMNGVEVYPSATIYTCCEILQLVPFSETGEFQLS